MAKHKKRNMRKAKIKRHNIKTLKNEEHKMTNRISTVCPENSNELNKGIGEYYSNLDNGMKGAFNELIELMESGEIYE